MPFDTFIGEYCHRKHSNAIRHIFSLSLMEYFRFSWFCYIYVFFDKSILQSFFFFFFIFRTSNGTEGDRSIISNIQK